MSQVKFEQRETFRTTGGVPAPSDFARGLPRDAPKGRQDLAHEVGNYLTKDVGANGYLAVSERRPQRWRWLTVAVVP